MEESTFQISSINHGPESNVTNILQLEETRWSWGPSISLTPHDHRFIRAEERKREACIKHTHTRQTETQVCMRMRGQAVWSALTLNQSSWFSWLTFFKKSQYVTATSYTFYKWKGIFNQEQATFSPLITLIHLKNRWNWTWFWKLQEKVALFRLVKIIN